LKSAYAHICGLASGMSRLAYGSMKLCELNWCFCLRDRSPRSGFRVDRRLGAAVFQADLPGLRQLRSRNGSEVVPLRFAGRGERAGHECTGKRCGAIRATRARARIPAGPLWAIPMGNPDACRHRPVAWGDPQSGAMCAWSGGLRAVLARGQVAPRVPAQGEQGWRARPSQARQRLAVLLRSPSPSGSSRLPAEFEVEPDLAPTGADLRRPGPWQRPCGPACGPVV
jgi:hypothetical protein